MPQCPECHAPLTVSRKGGWICEDCGYRAPASEGPQSATQQISVRIEQLPSVLAIPLGEYEAETQHPVMRLHRLCDAVESLTRFSTIVALSELRRSLGDAPLPAALLGKLQPHVELPTFGRWRNMLEVVTDELGRDDTLLVVPELREWVRGHLLPALNELVDLRNLLAHGGATPRAFAEEHLRRWEPWLASQVEELEFLAVADVCFLAGGQAQRLVGPSAATEHVEIADDVREELCPLDRHVVLLRDKQWLDLWPLCDYGRAVITSLQGRREAGSDSPMIYIRAERDRLLYAALGVDLPHGERPDVLQEFRTLFQLTKRVATSANEVADFEEEIRFDAGALIGRVEEVRRAKEVIKATDSGVLWVGGPGGIGKSFLMAKLAEDYGRSDKEHWWRIAWRFKGGDAARCNRAAFFRHAVKRLATWLGTEAAPTDDPNELYDQLRTLLDTASEAAGTPPRRVLFVLDGLDEIERLDHSFAYVPFQLSNPHVVWLCGGRPEGSLPSVFASERCTYVFPDGLPDMSPSDIRGMLVDRTGSLKYHLLPLDTEQANPDGTAKIVNAAVDAVVERAHGLPLYVNFVVQDILAGHVHFEELPFRLPDSLNNYYDDLLRRLSIGALQALLSPLLVTIAWARAPLDEETLHLLMVRRKVLLSGERSKATLRRGLEAMQSMLRLAPKPGGGYGYELYHPTFREHIQEDKGSIIGDQNPLAREAFAGLAMDWASLPKDHPARAYAVRFGPQHLVALRGDQVRAAVALFLDPAFLRESCELRQVADFLGEIASMEGLAPPGSSEATLLALLRKALSAESFMIANRPDTAIHFLFQRLSREPEWRLRFDRYAAATNLRIVEQHHPASAEPGDALPDHVFGGGGQHVWAFAAGGDGDLLAYSVQAADAATTAMVCWADLSGSASGRLRDVVLERLRPDALVAVTGSSRFLVADTLRGEIVEISPEAAEPLRRIRLGAPVQSFSAATDGAARWVAGTLLRGDCFFCGPDDGASGIVRRPPDVIYDGILAFEPNPDPLLMWLLCRFEATSGSAVMRIAVSPMDPTVEAAVVAVWDRSAAVWAPDAAAHIFAMAFADGSIEIRNVRDGSLRERFDAPPNPKAIGLSDRFGTVVVGYDDGQVVHRRLGSLGSTKWVHLQAPGIAVQKLAILPGPPGATHVGVLGSDHVLRTWCPSRPCLDTASAARPSAERVRPLSTGTVHPSGDAVILGHDGGVVCLSAKSADVRWTTPLPSAARVTVHRVSGADDVIVSTSDGHVVALAASDGAVRWTARAGASVLASVHVASDLPASVVACSYDRRIYFGSPCDLNLRAIMKCEGPIVHCQVDSTRRLLFLIEKDGDAFHPVTSPSRLHVLDTAKSDAAVELAAFDVLPVRLWWTGIRESPFTVVGNALIYLNADGRLTRVMLDTFGTGVVGGEPMSGKRYRHLAQDAAGWLILTDEEGAVWRRDPLGAAVRPLLGARPAWNGIIMPSLRGRSMLEAGLDLLTWWDTSDDRQPSRMVDAPLRKELWNLAASDDLGTILVVERGGVPYWFTVPNAAT
jgi:uncharacterized Zn finger protein (UPF0148 family)